MITNFLNQFGLLFLQEYIPDQKYDLRTLAIGNNFFQYFRKATTDFRSNISCGGIPVPVEDYFTGSLQAQYDIDTDGEIMGATPDANGKWRDLTYVAGQGWQ